MKDKINLLIEDYKRRLNTINDLLKQPTPKKMMESENLYWERIRTKGSEYRTFIAELEKIDIPPSEEKKEEAKVCEHPYAFIYRKSDFERCDKCGKVLCEG